MYKTKTFLLSLTLLFLNTIAFAQFDNLHFEINWKEKQPFFTPEKKVTTKQYLLSFDKAVYEHNKHHLPIYNILLQVGSENVRAIIKNPKFQTLKKEEISQVVDIDKITNSINIKNKIKFSRKTPYLEVSIIPLRKNQITGQYEKLVSFDIELIQTNKVTANKKVRKSYANQSVLSSGSWVKIKIQKSGVYRLSFEELQNIGIQNPQNIRIFGNGGKTLPFYNDEERPDDLIENHILIKDNYVYFYGDGTAQWNYNVTDDFFEHELNLYSDYAYYFLSSDYNSGTNNVILTENQSTNASTHTITSFTDFQYHELDTSNLIGSGRLWVGKHFDFQTAYTFNFSFPNLVNGSLIKLRSSLVARSPISSSFTIEVNGNQLPAQVLPSVNYDYTSTYASQDIDTYETTVNNTNELSINVNYNKSTASSEGWLDFLCLNVQRELVYENKPLRFRNTASVGTGNVSTFQLSNANSSIMVWDITNPKKPRAIETTLNGNILSFRVNTDTLREFIAFEESMALSPVTQDDDVGSVNNQNLHGINQTDMVIVVHPEFIDYASELKDIHEAENKLKISLVTTNQVYNEFSSGAPDVSAIRDFMKMLYDRATTEDQMPKYLCLFGDGSFDNKHFFPENTNYILTYQSENSLSPTQSFVTDDFYGLLDDDEGGHEGLLDIGIGRLPVKTRIEAANAIQKIRNYLSIDSYSDWRNRICFIADDEDGNTHLSQADELSRTIKNNYPVFNIEKIYLDAYVQESSSIGQRYPEVNLKIDNQINKGLLVMNYTGHGGESGLAEERIISIDQINKWSNSNKLPIFMTATCEFSRFDNYEKTTAGEHVFLNPQGGAIAMFTTTRLVYATPNFQLNQNFYEYLFENNPTTGERYRLGDIMRLTKIATGSGINKRNFTLLGDPALELAYARLFVKTNSINNKPVTGTADTLKAYDKVKITGEIQNKTGTKVNSYNGVIYPTVFDKEQEVKTLNNDGDGVFTYSIRNNPLFKGKASVNNGAFQFNFIVPKDIRYNIDTGKICYYSSNLQPLKDGKGYLKNILIGGSGTENNEDKEGPQIQIYLNDENFVNGGITNNRPKLLAFLSDPNGINTTGNGIGHDIVATIDNQSNMQYTLNDYYESEIDDFTSGKINYSFPELEPGEHLLHLKAWDVYNNSSEDSIIFYVADSEKFEINHVLNYPNPFSTNTSFFFEHNRPNELLEVIIHVFTVSGKIVKTIRSEQLTTGFRSEGIPWNGIDDFGNKIGRGVYFYKLAVRTSQGEKAEKIEKILLLN